MPDLITTAQALALLPGLSAVEAAAVPSLIGPVSRSIEREVKHPLAYGSHCEVHRPGITRKIRLNAPPVIPGTVGLRTELVDVASLTCTDASAQRATASLTATTLTLSISKGGASGPVPLALADSPTLSDLATAVAGVPGWALALNPAYSGWLVADVEPNPGAMGAKGQPVVLVAFVRDISRWAMDWPDQGVVELLEGRPQEFRFADRTWGGSVGGFGSGAWTGSDPRLANVRCSYQAGYDPLGVSAPMVPEDLQLAAALCIKATIDAANWSGTITQASLGNTSLTIGEQAIIPRAASLRLSPYRLRRF